MERNIWLSIPFYNGVYLSAYLYVDYWAEASSWQLPNVWRFQQWYNSALRPDDSRERWGRLSYKLSASTVVFSIHERPSLMEMTRSYMHAVKINMLRLPDVVPVWQES